MLCVFCAVEPELLTYIQIGKYGHELPWNSEPRITVLARPTNNLAGINTKQYSQAHVLWPIKVIPSGASIDLQDYPRCQPNPTTVTT
jgi:hypothetical protein